MIDGVRGLIDITSIAHIRLHGCQWFPLPRCLTFMADFFGHHSSAIFQTAKAIVSISRRVRDPNTNSPITILSSRVSAGFATIPFAERQLIEVHYLYTLGYK